jgi:hypothetical protein
MFFHLFFSCAEMLQPCSGMIRPAEASGTKRILAWEMRKVYALVEGSLKVEEEIPGS